MAEPTGGGSGEGIRTENGVMLLLVPGYVKDEIMGMTLDEFGKERYWASNLARNSARPGSGRGWQSAPRATADRRATLFPERSGGEVGPAGPPWTQSKDEGSHAPSDIGGTTSWFRRLDCGTRVPSPRWASAFKSGASASTSARRTPAESGRP